MTNGACHAVTNIFYLSWGDFVNCDTNLKKKFLLNSFNVILYRKKLWKRDFKVTSRRLSLNSHFVLETGYQNCIQKKAVKKYTGI